MQNNIARSSIFAYAHIHSLPDEPCLVDLRLTDGSELKNCRIETSFTVRKEVDIYYKTSRIDDGEIVMWRYSTLAIIIETKKVESLKPRMRLIWKNIIIAVSIILVCALFFALLFENIVLLLLLNMLVGGIVGWFLPLARRV